MSCGRTTQFIAWEVSALGESTESVGAAWLHPIAQVHYPGRRDCVINGSFFEAIHERYE